MQENVRPLKRVRDSRTEQIQIVLSGDINGTGRLFGGKLMEWIDVVAAVTARRHSGHSVTTASIDNLQFKAAAHRDNTMVLIGRITFVGKTSMEVKVDTFVESLDGTRNLVTEAYVVLVALDENERPVPVPGLLLETPEEEREWEAGVRRYELRRQRRLEQF